MILLLRANDIPELTSFSGNIDADRLKPFIYIAQSNDIKRVLGVELYNKILEDFKNDALTGDYLTIYNNYVIDMLVYYSCSAYMAFGGYKISNSGVYKTAADGGTAIDYKETEVLIARYKQLAASVEQNFYKYISTINLPEYAISTDKGDNKIIPWY